MSLAHADLATWYRLTFMMKQEFGWSIQEVEGAYPFELEIYGALLRNYLETKRKLAEEGAR